MNKTRKKKNSRGFFSFFSKKNGNFSFSLGNFSFFSKMTLCNSLNINILQSKKTCRKSN